MVLPKGGVCRRSKAGLWLSMLCVCLFGSLGAQEADQKLLAVKDDIKGEGTDVKQAGDRAAYVNKLYDQSLTLELLTWLGEITTLPIVVKGILRGDTAEVAARHPNLHVACRMSHVACRMSHVACRMSHVACRRWQRAIRTCAPSSYRTMAVGSSTTASHHSLHFRRSSQS